MGVFNSKRAYSSGMEVIPQITNEICETMRMEGYEVTSQSLVSGGVDISITKGGLFKAIVGMKTALKVKVIPLGQNAFSAEASVGIFGQQAIPTAIMLLVTWPVLITQIWGLVQQSKLDDHILDLIQQATDKYAKAENRPLFCPQCGHSIMLKSKFCGECGEQL